LRVVAAVVLATAADAVLVAQNHLNPAVHLATALAHLHVQNLAQASCLEAGSTRDKKEGRSGETQKKLRGSLARKTENTGGARSSIQNGKIKWFRHSNLLSFGHHTKYAGCGRVRSKMLYNICFGHVLVAVRQGQRRDAGETGEERLGRCSARQRNISGFIGTVAS
jgi:hypothetical protein